MDDADDSLTRMLDTDNPRRGFLRKVLGVDAFGARAASLMPDADEATTVSRKSISIQVDVDRCTACGQCSRFCLPGALLLSESDNSFRCDSWLAHALIAACVIVFARRERWSFVKRCRPNLDQGESQ